MELHYSQTGYSAPSRVLLFYYHMELHYSQTDTGFILPEFIVLLPYGITLLSNIGDNEEENKIVLLPYGITLLSNHRHQHLNLFLVLLPYGITLLSN